jgi:hypothetical protein
MRTRVFFAAFCMAVAASAQSAIDLNVVINAKSVPPIRPVPQSFLPPAPQGYLPTPKNPEGRETRLRRSISPRAKAQKMLPASASLQ